MKIVLVDNGSLEPAAHDGLRRAASAISEKTGMPVEAVSWKHSDRIPAGALGHGRGWTLAPWIRSQAAAGEREFLFIPFFISPQGAIGSSLRGDLEKLVREAGGIDFSFTEGLSADASLPAIIVERVRETIAETGLHRPAVIVVDHGGPSAASGAVRDRIATAARTALGSDIASLVAASMETPEGPGFEFNRPLLSEALSGTASGSKDVVIAPLFLSPGRHAGAGGDLRRIAAAAESRCPGLKCHFTHLVGSHPIAIETLAGALTRALRTAAHS